MDGFTTVLVTMCVVFLGVILLSVAVIVIRKLFSRSPKLGRILPALVVGGAIFGAAYWFISREIASHKAMQNEKRDAVERERKQRQQTQTDIEALISMSNAARDWKNSVCKQDYVSPVLTSELQSALMRTDSRPVLITGSLRDMNDQDGQYVLTLSAHLCRDARIQVELEANSDQARVMLAHRSESLPYYAVAAQVSSVKKAAVVPENNDSVFLVRGRCLDLVFTGFDGFSIDMDESLAKSRR
jgi:hypothetical protein